MTKTFTAQAVAFSLAALVTVSLLASVSGVADQQYQGAVVAHAAPATTTIATQHVVIVGKRIARA